MYGLPRMTIDVLMSNRRLQLGLFDTAGQDVYDKIRILTYAGTDVILCCFSVINPVSYQNVSETWIEELRRHAPKSCPIVLVGTQIDLREDQDTLDNLQKKKLRPLSTEQGESLARRLKVHAYEECSALTQKNLKAVFDTAIVAALNPVKKKDKTNIFTKCFSPDR
ncbi:cdc42 homolog isoform X2 [Lineus longissimus]|uniref:cdc42 homolog isoform X2 n=1 Tax=Lineus longissimus TaxID=88925 RepID=UPI00315CF1A3